MHPKDQNNEPRVKVAVRADNNVLPVITLGVITLGLILSLVVVLLNIGALSGS